MSIYNSNIYNNSSIATNTITGNVNPAVDDIYTIGEGENLNWDKIYTNTTHTNTISPLSGSAITISNDDVTIGSTIAFNSDPTINLLSSTGKQTIRFNSTTGLAVPSSVASTSIGDKITMYDDGTERFGIGCASNQLWMTANGNANSNIAFYSGSTSSSPSERMRVTSDGRLLIGTTAVGTAATPIAPLLDINGPLMIGNTASNPAQTRADGSKDALLLAIPRTISQQPVCMLFGDNTTSTNILNIGGGRTN